jgi:hypothetical protein
MNPDQQTTLWLGAFRYYLGRTSYAVSDFCDLLIQQWYNIPRHCQMLIQKELENAFLRDDMDREYKANYLPLGHDCDRQQWEKVRELWS